MIFKYFENDSELSDFLENLQENYRVEELWETFALLYSGFGDYDLEEEIKSKLRYPLFETKIEKLNFERESIEKPSL